MMTSAAPLRIKQLQEEKKRELFRSLELFYQAVFPGRLDLDIGAGDMTETGRMRAACVALKIGGVTHGQSSWCWRQWQG